MAEQHVPLIYSLSDKALRWNVPSSVATMTILPAFACDSQNSTISGRKLPSSMPIT